ncbi:MAG: HAMP domain-containing protein, partial [Planctomycetes bacterium]|nr:HAMP domain-containing protein [Planctomycetota bacterium]
MFSKSETKFFRRVGVRLTAYYTLCVLATGVILGAFLYYRLSHKLTRDVAGILEDTSKDILSFLDPATANPDPIIRQLHNEVRATKHYRLSGRLISADGRVLGVSDYFFDYAYPVRTDAFQQALAGRPVHEAIRVPLHRYTYHLLTTPAVVNGQTRYVLQLAIYGKPVRKTLRYFMVALLAGALPILLVLSLGVGGYIARRSLTPIHEMDTALRRITAARLQERIPRSHSGDELDQLAGTLNQMLERLEDSFRRSAEFSANAAHELRTPVATLRSAAELMVKGPHRASECHETAQRILVHCDRMSRMINDLLLLHRIECNPQEIQFAPVRLSALLKEIAAAFA